MASITLNYDGHNPIARKSLDYILSLGVFDVESHGIENAKSPGARKTRRAIRDVERGNVIKCGSFDDFVKRMSDV